LCITYNTFSTELLSLKDVSLDYHLTNLTRLVLTAIISECTARGIHDLSSDDRHFLYLFTIKYFSNIERSVLKESINSVKNLPDKALEWWNKFTGPIGLVVNALLNKIGLGSTEIKEFAREGGSLGSHSEQLQLLRRIANKLGKSAIYVLIDRVDELPITNTASASYDFIAPLLTNLQLLESPGYSFKFFLWDMLLPGYQHYARPDRIKYHILLWTQSQLRTMLSERLRAYSQGRVSSLGELLRADASFDDLVIYFALGSPRTIIRMCKEIIDQQSEINSDVDRLSLAAWLRGFDTFAKNFAHETVENAVLRDLKRLRQVNFTVRHIASDVFKFTQQAGIAKIKQWQDAGIVEKVGTIKESPGSRPSNLYGLKNPLVGKYLFSDVEPAEFTQEKLRRCHHCDALLIRDWDRHSQALCHKCDSYVTRDADE